MIAYLKNEVDFFYLFDKRSYFLRILKLQRINLFADVKENYKRKFRKKIITSLLKNKCIGKGTLQKLFLQKDKKT